MESKGFFEALTRGFGLFLAVGAVIGLATTLTSGGEFSNNTLWIHFALGLVIGSVLLLRGGVIADRVYGRGGDESDH